jgi:hypothetical protein
MNSHNGSHRRGLVLFLTIATLAVRLIWWAALPRGAVSVDLRDWSLVAGSLSAGLNPYNTLLNGVLNWPPFWMESLYALMRFSLRFNIEFYTAVRIYLLLADLAVLYLLARLMRTLDPRSAYGRVLFWGYALNPVLTLLIIQHCNFDVFAMIWVVLALYWLVRFSDSDEPIDWLLACGCLGLGGFTKTFPILLWPMLAPGARKFGLRGGVLGALLLIAPAILSVLPLYVLSPANVTEHLLKYRGAGTGFGAVSLFTLAGATDIAEKYISAMNVLIPAALFALGAIFWSRGIARENLPLVAGLIFLASFTLGSGYASQ